MTFAAALHPKHAGPSYRALFHLAAGGMATVDAAVSHGPHGAPALVALKRMRRELASSPQLAEMFVDEARIAAAIRSDHVVAIRERGRLDGRLFLAMELVVGTTLGALLRGAAHRGAPLPIGVAVRILGDVARGLRDAHEATDPFGAPLAIVHRDVSPQNVLITKSGVAKLADFGVARAAQRAQRTDPSIFKGKLSYAAPEQLTGVDVDARADLFAWGLVAWEVLTGERPFPRGATPTDIALRIQREPIPDPRTVRPEIPAALAALVLSALERDRDARIPTARAIADAIDAIAIAESLPCGRDVVAAVIDHLVGADVRALERRLEEAWHADRADDAARSDARASGVHSRPRAPEPAADDAPTQVEIALPPPLPPSARARSPR